MVVPLVAIPTWKEDPEARRAAAIAADTAKYEAAQLVESTPAPDRRYHYAGAPVRTTYPNVLLTLTNVGYAVGYDEVRKNPAWVAYRLFKVENPTSGKRPSRFKVDHRTEAKVSHDDYTNSGYDRVRMAPNRAIAACYGRQAQIETFLLSNVCPQSPDTNEGIWSMLEGSGFSDVRRSGEAWVVIGPVLTMDEVSFWSWCRQRSEWEPLPEGVRPDGRKLSKEIAETGILVPPAFYKIVMRRTSSEVSVRAWLVHTRITPGVVLARFEERVDRIEEITGLDFMEGLPDDIENALESEWPTANGVSVPVIQE